MCLIGIAWQAHPDFPLIVAANRDEFHARPTAASGWWPDAPDLLAGRDQRSGGSWMGITRGGRFAALTNFREPEAVMKSAGSRGGLVADFLTGCDSPESYVTSVQNKALSYAGFNLLVATRDALWYLGNRTDQPQRLAPGIYGLSNALLDDPWPKSIALKMALGAALRGGDREEPIGSTIPGLSSALFHALADTRPAADAELPHTGVPIERERFLSAIKIVSPSYGTRTATVLCIARDGSVYWEERGFDAFGAVTQTVRERFILS